MTDGVSMELSALAAGIQRSQFMRDRITAVVKAAWWNNDVGDEAATVTLDDLAWAVASNAAIRTTVAAAADEDTVNVIERGVRDVTDDDLEFVVLTVALPRLLTATAARK